MSIQKVHLEHVDLEDQKVRLRAVWMGRKIESFWRHFFGSKISTIFRVDFWALFWASKRA